MSKIVTDEDEADMGPDQDGLNNIEPQTDSSCRRNLLMYFALPLAIPCCSG
ncbi:MAG: hypothetical protein ACYS6K_14575 [Planctomycetota bacterium]